MKSFSNRRPLRARHRRCREKAGVRDGHEIARGAVRRFEDDAALGIARENVAARDLELHAGACGRDTDADVRRAAEVDRIVDGLPLLCSRADLVGIR